MKKIIRFTAALILIFLCAASVFSCSSNSEKLYEYSEYGLNFSLHGYMDKMTIDEPIEIIYGDKESRFNAQFFVYVFSTSELFSEMSLEKDISVIEYAEWFANKNGYTDVLREYDSEKDSVVMRYEDGELGYYLCEYIVRNEETLYHVTMFCDIAEREKYEADFEIWLQNISLADYTNAKKNG